VEKVNVNYNIIPFFAFDHSGKAVTNIKKEDVELLINNKNISDFIIIKNKISESPDNDSALFEKRAEFLKEKRIIFLVFDTRGSLLENQWSKKISKAIIKDFSDQTYFIVMRIHPFSGLQYISGPTKDKKLLCRNINKNIYKTYGRCRHLGCGLSLIKTYLSSIKNLGLATQIYKRERVTIYLFSRGLILPASLMELSQLQQTATELIKNGALLFALNPINNNKLRPQSGSIEVLDYLEKKLGGNYFYGRKNKILKNLREMNQAYYEIAFPVSLDFKNQSNKIKIKSKIPGIKIHSVDEISKEKPYVEMSKLEKELLALDIVEDGDWSKTRFRIVKAKSGKRENFKSTVYTVDLPDGFAKQQVDIFKVWINKDKNDAQVEGSSIIPGNEKFEIEAKTKKGYTSNIVIINHEFESALLSIN
jgi:hypothetical protein